MKKRFFNKKTLLYVLILLAFITVDVVYAKAQTSAEIRFCEYPSVLNTFKILGFVLILIKIIVPVMLLILPVKDFWSGVRTGIWKDGDKGLKPGIFMFARKLAACVLIFFVPTIINWAIVLIEDSVGTSEGEGFDACRTCIFEIDNCQIPDKDPEIYK